MERSTSWTPTRAVRAISLSEVPSPPRVGSRSTCRSGQTLIISATSGCSAALSVIIWVPNSSPSRTLMIAIPWTPIGPLTMITSPTSARRGWMSTPAGTCPMPAVFTYTWSP